MERFIGEEVTVLTENIGKEISGRSEIYFVVYFNRDGDIYEKNQLVRVLLLENREDGIFEQAN